MGGTMSRNKGARGEREVIKLLQPIVDKVYVRVGKEVPRLQRNTLQSDGGGFDIVGLEWLALEVKFQETFNLNKWWKQTRAQARECQLPVLVYRKGRARWRVRTLGTLNWNGTVNQITLVDITIDAFLSYFEAVLLSEVGIN